MLEKIYKREYKVVLHRRRGNSTEEIWVKFFSSISNCIRRGSELAVLTGQPGDVLEITHSNFGFLIATIKLKQGTTSFADMSIKFHLKECAYDHKE